MAEKAAQAPVQAKPASEGKVKQPQGTNKFMSESPPFVNVYEGLGTERCRHSRFHDGRFVENLTSCA